MCKLSNSQCALILKFIQKAFNKNL